MWQSSKFNKLSDSVVEHRIEQGFMRIKCRINADFLPQGGKLYIHSGKAKMCIGTLMENDGYLCIDKEYPVSYLNSQRIIPRKAEKFTLEAGDAVYSAYIVPDSEAETDKALLRAVKVLDSVSGNSDYSAEAEQSRNFLNRTLERFSPIRFDFAGHYNWYRITDITEDFGLSSVAHILYTPPFISAFRSRGCWYMGTSDLVESYAIGVFADESDTNPMVNALDCTTKIATVHGNFYAVGVGLYDCGQYFMKLDFTND